jgi:hypothetical protein
MKDLELLAAKFLTSDLPKPKEYLRKYFTGIIQERLVVYYLTFSYEDGNFKRFYKNFIDHTGIFCSERWVYKLIDRVKKVESRLKRAEMEKDHESVALVKMGKYWPRRKRCQVKP